MGEGWDCAECGEKEKRERGCAGEVRWHVGRHMVDGCPQKLLTPEALKAVHLWARFRRFGAPYRGGWMEWPAPTFDLIEALDAEEQYCRRPDDSNR